MSNQLVISPLAQDDLRDIYQFGLHNWGQAGASRYLQALKERLWVLTEQPLIGVECPELLSGVRSIPVESHIVFYRVRHREVEIIRVLHGRQDPNRDISISTFPLAGVEQG